MLPNLLIIGVPKAGTTSLFHYLNLQSDICGSEPKETNFFIPLMYGEEISSVESYERYFDHCSKRSWIMEATPGYFYGGQEIADTLKSILGKPKLIVIFRNPVDRLFSYFRHKKSGLHIDKDMTFGEYLDKCNNMSEEDLRRSDNYMFMGLKSGLYYEFLEEWYANFEDDDIKVLFFDDLVNESVKLVNEVLRWLNLSEVSNESELNYAKNVSTTFSNVYLHKAALSANKVFSRVWDKAPRLKRTLKDIYLKMNTTGSEVLDTTLRIQLQEYYHPFNAKLKVFLCSKGYSHFPSWLNS